MLPTWITEDPTVPVLVGMFLAIVWLVAWIQARANVWLGMFCGTVVLVLALVTASMWIVTDREAVAAAVENLEAALEANDVEAVVAAISPQAPALQAEARSTMKLATLESVLVDGLKISFPPPPPVAAVADFQAIIVAKGSLPQVGQTGNLMARRQFRLVFRKEQTGERWLLFSYEHSEPPTGGKP